MIRELRLHNFQKHKSLKLSFGPGLNLVVGPSDQGKSAVFRALKWVALHGSATGLMTHGETSMKVGILGDEAPVIRFRDSKKNGYQINDQKLVAVGQNQPDEVRQILGLTEINFQAQHDPPFLLGMTPGQIAKEINKIVDLEAIDKILSQVKSKTTGQKQIIASLEPKVEEAKAAEQALAWVPGAVQAWEHFKGIFAGYSLVCKDAETVASRLVELGEVHEFLAKAQLLLDDASEAWERKERLGTAYLDAGTTVNALGRILSDLGAVRHLDQQVACMAAMEGLVGVYQEVDALEDQQVGLQGILGNLWEIENESKDVVAVGKALSSVVKVGQESEQLDVARCTLQALLEDIAWCEVEIKKLGGDITELERKARLCPTCGKPL